MIRRTYALFLATLSLTACGGGGPVADKSENTSSLAAPLAANGSDPTGAPPPANAPPRPTASTSGEAPAIPGALHGRWGLVPEDCIPEQGDNLGVLEISGGELRFHESIGRPLGNARSAADSYSADFAFDGQGQRWTKFQTLRLQDGKLVRTESTPMASYTYVRCQ
jgi:hypothetical protein